MVRTDNSTSQRKNAADQSWRTRFSVYLFALALVLTPPVSIAQQDSQETEFAGRVIQTKGAVAARDVSGSDRNLRRGSQVFEGETIFTDAGSSVQMRMTPSSHFRN
ncbi:MAG: hypothetical protein RKH07_15015 [Gammaproteobacteria bacterium]